MIKDKAILHDPRLISLFASIVMMSFAYGVLVGFSGKMLTADNKSLATRHTVHGRFGQVAKTL